MKLTGQLRCVYLYFPALCLGCSNKNNKRKPSGKPSWSCWRSGKLPETWTQTSMHVNLQPHALQQNGGGRSHLLKACSRSSSILSVMLMNLHWTGRKLPSSAHWGGEPELWMSRRARTWQLPGPGPTKTHVRTTEEVREVLSGPRQQKSWKGFSIWEIKRAGKVLLHLWWGFFNSFQSYLLWGLHFWQDIHFNNKMFNGISSSWTLF